MTAPQESPISISVESVTPEQQEFAREMILEDCLGIDGRGAVETYTDMMGPRGMDELSHEMGVPSVDARFRLYLSMVVSQWAARRLE